MWAEGNGLEGKPQMKVMFQASMTGRRVEPLIEVVMGQVNVPLGSWVWNASCIQEETSDSKGDIRRKGKESYNLKSELQLGAERKERDLGEDIHLGAGARERDIVGGEF